MSFADWIMVLAVVLSIAQAAAQGFFTEAFSLSGVVLGFLLASWNYPRTSAWFQPLMNSHWAADIAGFLTIFIGIALLAGVAGRISSWGMQQAGLKWVDRVLGGAFGFVRGLLLITAVVFATTVFAPDSKWLGDSFMAPYFLVVGRAAAWVTPPEIRSRAKDGIQVLNRARLKAEKDIDKSSASPASRSGGAIGK